MEGIHRVIKNNYQAYKRPSIFSGLKGNRENTIITLIVHIANQLHAYGVKGELPLFHEILPS